MNQAMGPQEEGSSAGTVIDRPHLAQSRKLLFVTMLIRGSGPLQYLF